MPVHLPGQRSSHKNPKPKRRPRPKKMPKKPAKGRKKR